MQTLKFWMEKWVIIDKRIFFYWRLRKMCYFFNGVVELFECPFSLCWYNNFWDRLSCFYRDKSKFASSHIQREYYNCVKLWTICYLFSPSPFLLIPLLFLLLLFLLPSSTMNSIVVLYWLLLLSYMLFVIDQLLLKIYN